MKGLNWLNGFKLLNLHLVDVQSDGIISEGKVLIPNAYVMAISLGKVTMNLSIDGTKVGKAHLNDLVLQPGDNTVPVKAIVDPATMVRLLALKKGTDLVVPVDITALDNSSVYDDGYWKLTGVDFGTRLNRGLGMTVISDVNVKRLREDCSAIGVSLGSCKTAILVPTVKAHAVE
ncbi:hypothetical protein EYZ11_012925 [Aspergillus tanneri]|uniref:Uncharacterized protein n=1 Tax=Aspergillus tanneri TaxID=1220188 RepID=A0A4S3IYZ3_9EURO|nr:hypothetical protein EYZ11_012925 [Aspergillus tanneri]